MAEEGILKIGFHLQKRQCSLREYFEDYIFDEVFDGKEYELLPIRDFSEVVRQEMSLDEKHV